ncbi:hypothetical protein IVB41_31110 [Bradyrhizobium sp. 44]|jgi:hypothetical protein|uniref:hypothetical protein n=1 Tax=unclassified Bradyrhizobium TaxID=2631580 RepID=UPI001FFBB977|nr:MULTISPECIES: hypothetical protein [unclassified Bradyrhizobium]MCK1288363.1 hypothetical protein [Bradyrhizobium sp. 44]MCK1368492.1 hypothetical protein [Bradyrhizobium sp. 62]
MEWIFALLILLFLYRRTTRAGDRLAELKPTGMLRSPLFYAQTALLCALLMLMFAPAYLPHEQWAVVVYLVALITVITALLFVRRALKWRYPI